MAARKEKASSIFLLLVGIGYLLYDTRYSLDTLASPGPGVFPLCVGVFLVSLAGWQLIQVSRPAQSVRETGKGRSQEALPGQTKPWLMVLILVLYLLAVSVLGFMVSTFLLVVVSSRLLGEKSWNKPVALAIVLIVSCYYLFETWLKVPLPRGYLL
ncbi:MAG: tripartite tricarboxylate transporter TctB family protein [Firmicutes bacterium]|nr:tripartite tricarboxylate transporter TctB family protein [Bacillota bacterium]